MCGRSVDLADTLSLRGPAQFTHEAWCAEFTGGMDEWDGTEYQKCPPIFFTLGGYVDHVYIYLYIQSKVVGRVCVCVQNGLSIFLIFKHATEKRIAESKYSLRNCVRPVNKKLGALYKKSRPITRRENSEK